MLLFLLIGCAGYPTRKFSLPLTINEASGLVIEEGRFIWHNDSGDGPYLYTTDTEGSMLKIDTLSARASDYEDIAQDRTGILYVGDFGNNRGRRTAETVYIHDRQRGTTDSIVYTYPRQDGSGRLTPGNYDCEALVQWRDSLHLFTKDLLGGERNFSLLHFRLPTRPGNYEAELVDSLHLPRRVVTGAALDEDGSHLYLVTYNFRMLLGFLPTSSASLITLTDFPTGHFLRGKLRRRNIAWGLPTQHEAVAVYDEKYLYVGAEATRIRRHAIARRLKRR
jgi:hypothetical protein